MALLDNNSEEYLKECNEKNLEPDRTQLIGMTREDILKYFYRSRTYHLKSEKWITEFFVDDYKSQRLNFD